MSISNAIGLIEVIGLSTAIEATDSALKAANVKLIAVAKADAGILTIEITGDVGAVNAAVKAGAAAAERVGQVRASHVIPRVEESLIGSVIRKEDSFHKKKAQNINSDKNDIENNDGNADVDTDKYTGNTAVPEIPSDSEKVTGTIVNDSIDIDATDKAGFPSDLSAEHDRQENFLEEKLETKAPSTMNSFEERYEELKKMSNQSLRSLIQSKGKQLNENELKNLRKLDYIQMIIDLENEEGES